MYYKIFISSILLLFVNTIFAQLTINPGGFVTINQSGSLYVGTTLKINSNATGSGYLVDKTVGGDVTVLSNINIERYIGSTGWHNTSSPVSNANTSVYTNADLTFYYDETIILNDWNFGWVWYQGPLNVMKGYDVYIETSTTTNYTAPNNQYLNTGFYNMAITHTDVANGEVENRKGWNLIGNPYPSPVDWLMESGWDKTDINDAKYIWNPSNNNYTIFLGGSSPTGINEGTQYIPSNQGFWVQAIQNGTLSITNSTRVGTTTSTPDYYKNQEIESQELRLIAHGNGYNDETMIRFLPGSTKSFDINKDASKLFSGNDSVPQIYSHVNNSFLAINTLPKIVDGLSVNLSFSCNTPGIYSIAMADISTISPINDIYLKDIKEQKIINLSNEYSYQFQHNPNNSKQRFIIYFNPPKDIINNIKPDFYFTVNTSKTTLNIIRNTTQLHNGKVQIYNLLGQKIMMFKLTDNVKTSIDLQVPAGYYIVSIITNNYVSNTKIRITR